MKLPLPVLCLTVLPLLADWRDDTGFTRLQTLAGTDLPTSVPAGLTQTEALADGNYAPDTSLPEFSSQIFNQQSGPTDTSSHATDVAQNYYGTLSLLPGPATIDLYGAGDWIGSGFLNRGTNSLPDPESRAVQNHSWINTGLSDSYCEEVNLRLDYAIERDGLVCVVGMNNGSSTTLPQLLGQSYHTISVGRSDGLHSAGFTTFDGSGRIKPEIVAPANATSYSTPIVAGAAGLIVAKISAAPDPVSGADKSRIAKAILLASASKDTLASWANTETRPLDLRYGAGELNVWHAWHTLRAGRATASSASSHPPRGWAAESADASSARTYFFTIPPGAPSTPFSAALTWHRAVTASRGIFGYRTWNGALADLNLRLHQASGLTIGTQLTSSHSTVDNLELIHDAALPPGDYALVVHTDEPTATDYALAWHSLPAVTIAATVPNASEIDGSQAAVTVTRTGETTLPLLVPLTYSGTAIPGTDYLTPPAQITIPAGAASATLQIVPVSDDLAQGDRTITVSIGTDFSLASDPAAAANLTLEDKPFDSWRASHFSGPQLDDPATSGETADPDHDSLANLIEYALGLDPNTPDPSPLTASDTGEFLTIGVDKHPDATDIVWAAQITSAPPEWAPALTTTNTSTRFEARDPIPVADSPRRFIRLRITRP